jgi:hypothetical protein
MSRPDFDESVIDPEAAGEPHMIETIVLVGTGALCALAGFVIGSLTSGRRR